MAKYKVLSSFRDKETGTNYTKDEVVDILVKKANALNKRGREHKDVLSNLLKRLKAD